jgi:hypothetical protein
VTPDQFLIETLLPGLHWLEQHVGPVPPASREARLLLLAISGQESNWVYRIQSGNGPAHGFWQFERMGGVNGVLTHPATVEFAKKVCAAAGIAPTAVAVWGRMATEAGDNLAVAFARLLLFTDPHKLPAYGDEEGSWAQYISLWRPGAVTEGGKRASDARRRWSTFYIKSLVTDKASGGGP